MSVKHSLALAIATLIIPGALFAETYKVDASHADVGFAVRHLGVSKTRGQFGNVSGKINYDANNLEVASFSGTIAVDSINTNNAKRDKHLRSKDFFFAKEHPEINFQSTRVYKEGDQVMIDGDLTMRGVTKPITIPVDVYGPVKGPGGKKRIGFEGSTKIDRRDFDLTWNRKLKAGDLVVANEVELVLDIEGIEK